MLPTRWIIPAGGLTLAMAFLTPAIDLSKESLWRIVTARPAIDIGLNDDRAEWREFTSLVAARRRADELNRLRELPTEPVHTHEELAAPSVGPHDRISDERDHEAPSNVQPIAVDPINTDGSLAIEFPVAGHPIKDDDSLSIEFPVSAAAEIKPQTLKTPRHPRAPNVRRQANVLAGRQQTRAQDFFEFPFGSQFGNQAHATSHHIADRPAEQEAPTFSNNH